MEKEVRINYELDVIVLDIMGAPDIKDKLRIHVNNGDFAKSEVDVVYFMVGIRKLLENNSIEKSGLSTLKFYCDWVVHTKKDRSIKTINHFLNSLEEHLKGKRSINWKQFIAFQDIEKELLMIANYEGIRFKKEAMKVNMNDFKRHLGKVLIDQPIIIDEDNYISEVKTKQIATIVAVIAVKFREINTKTGEISINTRQIGFKYIKDTNKFKVKEIK